MWRRSSFCEGGHCIEVAVITSPACVEGAPVTAVALRSADGSAMGATLAEWRAFVAGVKAGEFDYISAPVVAYCRKPVNGNPFSLTISNQCMRDEDHEGACTADATEAARMGGY